METNHDSIGCSVKSFLKYFLSSWVFPSTLVAVVVGDQWSKLAVRASLSMGERMTAIDGLLNIVYTTNRGIAFGILSDNRSQYKPLLLSLGALVAVVIFTWFAAKYGGRRRYVAFAVALLVGGTIGNLIDRLSYGAVIDFVDFYFGSGYHWAAFNVADMAVSIATFLILIRILKAGFWSHDEAKKGDADSDQVLEPSSEQELPD